MTNTPRNESGATENRIILPDGMTNDLWIKAVATIEDWEMESGSTATELAISLFGLFSGLIVKQDERTKNIVPSHVNEASLQHRDTD
jgi:hypothetical protein